jgi:hypothetical protein
MAKLLRPPMKTGREVRVKAKANVRKANGNGRKLH